MCDSVSSYACVCVRLRVIVYGMLHAHPSSISSHRHRPTTTGHGMALPRLSCSKVMQIASGDIRPEVWKGVCACEPKSDCLCVCLFARPHICMNMCVYVCMHVYYRVLLAA